MCKNTKLGIALPTYWKVSRASGNVFQKVAVEKLLSLPETELGNMSLLPWLAISSGVWRAERWPDPVDAARSTNISFQAWADANHCGTRVRRELSRLVADMLDSAVWTPLPECKRSSGGTWLSWRTTACAGVPGAAMCRTLQRTSWEASRETRRGRSCRCPRTRRWCTPQLYPAQSFHRA